MDIPDLIQGVLDGDRRSLARAITLIESERAEDQECARELLEALLPATGNAVRVGVSGAPGVGKSTLIETLGLHLVELGNRPAVLAVDPSSTVSGGSILGDKSRMDRLAQVDEAFIRPSPSSLTLGGVARRTREAMLLCEAAGYDVVLVETVGVGQSETQVAQMVDFFLVLLQPGSGDELQGIKKGILEHANAWVVNKADGANLPLAKATLAEYQAALGYVSAHEKSPTATTISALDGSGIPELWDLIAKDYARREQSGDLRKARREQESQWIDAMARALVVDRFEADDNVAEMRGRLLNDGAAGSTSPWAAARQLVNRFLNQRRE